MYGLSYPQLDSRPYWDVELAEPAEILHSERSCNWGAVAYWQDWPGWCTTRLVGAGHASKTGRPGWCTTRLVGAGRAGRTGQGGAQRGRWVRGVLAGLARVVQNRDGGCGACWQDRPGGCTTRTVGAAAPWHAGLARVVHNEDGGCGEC